MKLRGMYNRVSLFFATLVNDRYDSTEAKFSRQQLIKKYSIRTHQFCNPAFPINKEQTRKIAQGSTDRIIHYQLLPTKSGFSAIISIVDQSCVHFLKNNDTLVCTKLENVVKYLVFQSIGIAFSTNKFFEKFTQDVADQFNLLKL